MSEKSLNVNSVSLYREIARNLVNPLEVIREAISNSHDAKANDISISIYYNNSNQFCIELADDGEGMGEIEFERFFNLGDSLKATNNIGQKGLGTKTYFRSAKLTIESQPRNGNKRYQAILIDPWEKLNKNELPKYDFNEIDFKPGSPGTIINIVDYKIDNPEKIFNFRRLKDYILWFTAAGSFKTKFAEYTTLKPFVQNLHISPSILLSDEISKEEEQFSGGHRFSPPNENPSIDPSEPQFIRSNNYCKHFGPYHKETQINGEYVSFQLYGTISGINKRNEISSFYQGEKHKSRFGLYLCKDFIPIINRFDLLKDSNYQHYHILVNSQNFDLTADRNNISNEDNLKSKWIFEELEKIIVTEIKPSSESVFFKMRKEEEVVFKQKERLKELGIRKDKYSELTNLDWSEIPIKKVPTNEAQVALIFSALLAKNLIPDIKIGTYSDKSTTDLICENKDGTPFLVELEYKISNIFQHGHAYETFDMVVCWFVDYSENEIKMTPEGKQLKLIKEKNKWFLKYGPAKTIPIIELKSFKTDTKE
jgi:hypothetical protein